MNILYLVPDLFGRPGGIARYCRLVARTLCESQGVGRLNVIALWDHPGTGVDSEYLFGEGTSYLAMGGNHVAFTTAALGALARGCYDLILFGHVAFAPLSIFRAPRRTRTRYVTFIYGTDAWQQLPPHKRWALRRSDTVIAISRYTADRAMVANALDTRKLRVLHNCLDPAFEPGPLHQNHTGPHALAGSGRVVLTVSRLVRAESGKGHSAVLRALPSVLERVPDLRYAIVGEGDLRPELEALAREVGVAGSTHFLGAVSDAEIGQIMRASELYVMPSRSEGFGFVFLEAMAYGLPIVAGNQDASPEVLGGEDGLVVDPDDVAQIASAMLRLLSDADLSQRLGTAGRRRLDAMFRYPRFKATLLSHLSELQCGELGPDRLPHRA